MQYTNTADERQGCGRRCRGEGDDIDLLHDEAVDYATRLDAAGVPCELHIEPGMYHGADSIRPRAPTARRFTDTMTRALARAVSPDAPR